MNLYVRFVYWKQYGYLRVIRVVCRKLLLILRIKLNYAYYKLVDKLKAGQKSSVPYSKYSFTRIR